MNKIQFESGKEYSLAEIFSGENKIIIPDLQRDYCWGGNASDGDQMHELVTDFVTSLIELFNQNSEEEFTMGLIYGYEQPKSHIQLCDGQQRITTLFLLLGILNRKTNGKFQSELISEFELNQDDKEPYLQYAIRESTLFFLSDLVCRFFLDMETESKPIGEIITESDWYFDEYSLDASIVSMINALELIDRRLALEDENLDYWTDFGNFILHKINMLYYDMGNRSQGEETFVIINTTGEPLTPTENLKPIFINKLPEKEQQNVSKWWEEWETYFWKNRKGEGGKQNDTSDKGFLEFFRWVILLNTSNKEDFRYIANGNKITIKNLQWDEDYVKVAKTIQEYFEIVKFLFDESGFFLGDKDLLAPEDMNSQIDWFRILPVIEYVKRFGYVKHFGCVKRFGKDNLRNIERVKMFFRNMAKNNNVSSNIGTMLPLAVKVIKDLPTEDIASMEEISKTLLTEEEKQKFTIYKNASNREELEDAFWKEEDHVIWNGEIKLMLDWSSVGNQFDFDKFKKYSKTFSVLFNDLESSDLDILRRALLTTNLGNYPGNFRSPTNASFCLTAPDWKALIFFTDKENDNNNSEVFKSFIDELLDKDKKAVWDKMNDIIDNYDGTIDELGNKVITDYYEFVKRPELLEYCVKKNIQWNDEGIVLLKKEKMSGEYKYLKDFSSKE